VAPTFLEALLTEDPLIAQAVVFGDRRNYLSALIVPDQEALRGELAARGLPSILPPKGSRTRRCMRFMLNGLAGAFVTFRSAKQIGKIHTATQGPVDRER
jgi:long-subunit acyl-CoA synthetase (AMP-forming)